MPSENNIRISVIVPVRNERDYIEGCLLSLLNQSFPQSNYEIIVVDGDSVDGSLAVVQRLISTFPNIRILCNPQKGTAAGLNIGIRHSRGEIITRLDGHCLAHPSYLEQIDLTFRTYNVAAVGGYYDVMTMNLFQRALAIALSSDFGTSSLFWKQDGQRKISFVKSVPMASYRKKIFDEVGLFDETMMYAEDDEFNWRLIKAGHDILITPLIRFQYSPRRSLSSLSLQYFQYGRGRVRLLRKYKSFCRLKHLIPPILVSSLGVGIVLSLFSLSFHGFFVAVLMPYLLFDILLTTYEALRWSAKPKVVACLPSIFPSLHLSYGCGFIYEFFYKAFIKYIALSSCSKG